MGYSNNNVKPGCRSGKRKDWLTAWKQGIGNEIKSSSTSDLNLVILLSERLFLLLFVQISLWKTPLKLKCCLKKDHFLGRFCCVCEGTRVASTIIICRCWKEQLISLNTVFPPSNSISPPVTNCWQPLSYPFTFSSLVWQPVVPKPSSHLRGHGFSFSLWPVEFLLCLCHMGAASPTHLLFAETQVGPFCDVRAGVHSGEKRGQLPSPLIVGKETTPVFNKPHWLVAIFCKPVKWAALSPMPSEIRFLHRTDWPVP